MWLSQAKIEMVAHVPPERHVNQNRSQLFFPLWGASLAQSAPQHAACPHNPWQSTDLPPATRPRRKRSQRSQLSDLSDPWPWRPGGTSIDGHPQLQRAPGSATAKPPRCDSANPQPSAMARAAAARRGEGDPSSQGWSSVPARKQEENQMLKNAGHVWKCMVHLVSCDWCQIDFKQKGHGIQ